MRHMMKWTIFTTAAAGMIMTPAGVLASNENGEADELNMNVHTTVASEMVMTNEDPGKSIAIMRAALNAHGYLMAVESIFGPNTWDFLAEDQSIENENESGNLSPNEKQEVAVASGEEAIETVKQNEDIGEDIRFDDLGGDLQEDGQGAYYTVQLTSQELSEAGGTGTVGRFKVYQNGEYTSVYGEEQNTGSNQEQDTDEDTERYVNARFGYQIDYPADWKPQPEADNGDGRVLQVFDESKNVLVFGSHEDSDKAEVTESSSYKEMELEKGGKGYYQLSEEEESFTFSMRVFENDNRYGFEAEVPEEQGAPSQEEIQDIAKTFTVSDSEEE
ncbi:hypothetical protein [Marinococcus luteus]|uniref:hypothetical protein n=1 Tax=Marinococcus luteus TaxID=1122204 RepID=UPI002ACCFE7D|nr:hypothetical protein [Marinococcus luteus]MDZ5783109.1 hypothetical protein [Marinococcus luteus]